jgi:hypothetical protein
VTSALKAGGQTGGTPRPRKGETSLPELP